MSPDPDAAGRSDEMVAGLIVSTGWARRGSLARGESVIRAFTSAVIPLSFACVLGACPTRSGSGDPPLVRCATPFSILMRSDDGHGHVVMSCTSLAGPPEPPPHAPGKLTSCAGMSTIEPPPALAPLACTYGLTSGLRLSQFFLCPKSVTLPPSPSPSQLRGDKYVWVPDVHNGCFGNATDPGYAYVWHMRFGMDPTPSGGCGADCAAP